MDVGLKPEIDELKNNIYDCFNPCFNGCRSEARFDDHIELLCVSFNPCFNGCRSEAGVREIPAPFTWTVSILVLMDVGLKLSSD